MKNSEIKKRNKYSKKAYKNFSTKIKPTLSRDLDEIQEDLGLSKPQLLRKLVDVYKENKNIVKSKKLKGEDIMKNERMIDKMNSKEGMWILGRNILAEKAFGDLIPDNLRYQAYKINKNGKYFLIYSVTDGIPNIKAYKEEKITFNKKGSKLEIRLDGEVEFSNVYIGDTPEEEREYLEEFLEDWDLTKEDIEKYSKTFEKQKLEEVDILVLPEEKDDRETSEEAMQHPLIKEMKSEKGVWFKENNLVAQAIFGSKTDEKLPPRAVNLKKIGEKIIAKFCGQETIVKTYHESDIVFEIDDDSVVMIRKEKAYDEEIEESKKIPKDTKNYPTLKIL